MTTSAACVRALQEPDLRPRPELISAWHAVCDAMAVLRAVQWLVEERLIEEAAAERFASDHPEPDLP